MATTRGFTRPATDAACKIFKSGNTVNNACQLQTWIREQELRRNQIISITANETDIENGDNVLTLFYRKNSIQPEALPLDTIKFDAFNSLHSWERQLVSVNEFSDAGRSVHTIGVSRTPKNIGSARCQNIWYTTESTTTTTHSNLISRSDGNWEAIVSTVHEWLNTYIAPHQLVSITFHEEMHPNNTGRIHALITHTAGSNPQKLTESPAVSTLPTNGGLYTMDFIRSEETEDACKRAVEMMNRRGGQEGHVVTTTNDSQRQDIFCVIFSWGAILEDQIEESLRPTGCAGCTIF